MQLGVDPASTAASTLSWTASLVMTNSAEVPGAICSRTRLDEVVVDPDVAQRPGRARRGRADGHPEQRDEEEQPEEQAPERAAQGAGAGRLFELLGLGLLLALRYITRRRRRP